MKIQRLLFFVLILCALSCSEEPAKPEGPYGPIQFSEFIPDPDAKPDLSRMPSNGTACNRPYAWKYDFYNTLIPSASTADVTYRFFPDRASVIGPTYDPNVVMGVGTNGMTMTIRVENRGLTPLKYSYNGGSTWNTIDRGAPAQYFDVWVPVGPPPPACGATEMQLSSLVRILWKSTGCPPGATYWQSRVHLMSCTNWNTSYYSSGGGMTVGFNFQSGCVYTN
ncbi:MAG: hypothetical protein QM762_12430 [Chryseolinea sp.]